MNRIRIRPYKASDAETILSWCQDEKTFYQWTAGILGDYPATAKEFSFVESLMPFTAFEEMGTVGFFTLRNPAESLDELRLGFVIVSPDKWGKGYGKGMLRLGLKFVLQRIGYGTPFTLTVFSFSTDICSSFIPASFAAWRSWHNIFAAYSFFLSDGPFRKQRICFFLNISFCLISFRAHIIPPFFCGTHVAFCYTTCVSLCKE